MLECLIFMTFLKYIFIPAAISFILYMGFYTYNNYFSNHKEPSPKLSETAATDTPTIFDGKYILADLTNMKIFLYNDDKLVSEYPIVSKGKPGSYYETPAGEFYIKSKQKNKFSSIGHVYMPYSMQFYGNFFLHGIPYYPNGTRVSTNYSGGCIRIADADMISIYNFADTKTRIKIENTNDYTVNQDISNAQNNIIDNNKDLSNYKNNKSFENINTILYSLENLDQEKYVTFNQAKIKLKDLNYYIAEDNQAAKNIVRNYISPGLFDKQINDRLLSMGIIYENKSEPSQADIGILVDYISINKKFILNYF